MTVTSFWDQGHSHSLMAGSKLQMERSRFSGDMDSGKEQMNGGSAWGQQDPGISQEQHWSWQRHSLHAGTALRGQSGHSPLCFWLAKERTEMHRLFRVFPAFKS